MNCNNMLKNLLLNMLTVDNDAAVMQGVMAEKEILLEINENEAVKEQEED